MIHIGNTGIVEEVLQSFESGSKDIALGDLDIDEYNTLTEKGYIVEFNAKMSPFICKDEVALLKLKESRLYQEVIKDDGNIVKPEWFIEDLGTLLGYPPSAVKAFTGTMTNWNLSIMVNYSGLIFKSFKDTIFEDITWLFENKPIDKEFFSLMITFEEESNASTLGVYNYSLLRVVYGTSIKEIHDAIRKILLTK